MHKEAGFYDRFNIFVKSKSNKHLKQKTKTRYSHTQLIVIPVNTRKFFQIYHFQPGTRPDIKRIDPATKLQDLITPYLI